MTLLTYTLPPRDEEASPPWPAGVDRQYSKQKRRFESYPGYLFLSTCAYWSASAAPGDGNKIGGVVEVQ